MTAKRVLSTDSLDRMIRPVALELHLPIDLVRAIVTVESSRDPGAKRYEPKFDVRYNVTSGNPFVHPEYSAEDEEKGRATSWGLMQVMGETARALGFRGKFEELLEPGAGIEFGCMYLGRLRDRYYDKWCWPGVVSAYNAGSPRLAQDSTAFRNQQYVDKVFRALGGAWPQSK